MIANVSTLDWISLAVAAICAGLAWLAKQQSLPIGARRWLGRIGQKQILEFVQQAEAFAEMTPDEKRAWVVAKLQGFTIDKLGFPVPTSIANLLVEFVYLAWKRAKR